MIFFDKTNFPFRLESNDWKRHFPMFIDRHSFTFINSNVAGDKFMDISIRKKIELQLTYMGILIQHPPTY
jgi:hypothetical protein